jgi:hypothetical protein
MQFCTVVARNYLAYARVLASSLHALDDDITILNSNKTNQTTNHTKQNNNKKTNK